MLYTLPYLNRTDNDSVPKLTPDYKPKMCKIWIKKRVRSMMYSRTAFTLISGKERKKEEDERKKEKEER